MFTSLQIIQLARYDERTRQGFTGRVRRAVYNNIFLAFSKFISPKVPETVYV